MPQIKMLHIPEIIPQNPPDTPNRFAECCGHRKKEPLQTPDARSDTKDGNLLHNNPESDSVRAIQRTADIEPGHREGRGTVDERRAPARGAAYGDQRAGDPARNPFECSRSHSHLSEESESIISSSLSRPERRRFRSSGARRPRRACRSAAASS